MYNFVYYKYNIVCILFFIYIVCYIYVYTICTCYMYVPIIAYIRIDHVLVMWLIYAVLWCVAY